MPHTVKLLRNYSNIDIDVFEQLFINATNKENTYRYLQEVLKDLKENKIVAFEDFNKHIETRKNNTKKEYINKKNKAHNFDSHIKYMSEEEVLKNLEISQNIKFGDGSLSEGLEEFTEESDPARISYQKAIECSWESLGVTTYNIAIKYAIKYNKPYVTR